MATLSAVSSNPTLVQYAQRLAQDAVMPVADFLAPGIEVPSQLGKFKKYTEKHRFRLANTRRALGGRATELAFDATDAAYNCQPYAVDVPIDNLEIKESANLENVMQSAADLAAAQAALDHEKRTIDAALAALGSGTNLTWNSSADPVDNLDAQILNVMKAVGYGSAMGIGLLFGATAWRIFKNADKVKGRYVVASGRNGGATGFNVPTIDSISDLFVLKPEIRVAYAVADSAAEGVASNNAFVLDSNVIVFARSPRPNRNDPSFMKTFRLMGAWMVPGAYERDDGRVQVAKFDWSEDVQVTNTIGGVRLNIS